jgi:hypothetical protein
MNHRYMDVHNCSVDLEPGINSCCELWTCPARAQSKATQSELVHVQYRAVCREDRDVNRDGVSDREEVALAEEMLLRACRVIGTHR